MPGRSCRFCLADWKGHYSDPLWAELFLHSLHRGKRDIAQLRHVPHTLAFPEQLDDLRILLLLLLTGLGAAYLPPHLHALLLRQLTPLGQAEIDVLPFLLCAEPKAADVDSHNAIHLPVPEQGQPLLLEMDVDAIVCAELDCLQDLPDGTTATGEFAEQDDVYLVLFRIGQALGQYLPLLVGLGSADVFLVDALDLVPFGGCEFVEVLDLSLCALPVPDGGDPCVDVAVHIIQRLAGIRFRGCVQGASWICLTTPPT